VDSVSVIIPTFKRPDALGATLAAMLRVDYAPDDLEVIVVDDAGGDVATARVVGAFASEPVAPRLIAQAQAGAAAARNAGAAVARGDWLFFCDDDIVVRPDHIRMHLETHREHAAAWVGGKRTYSPETFAALSASPFGRYWLQVEDRWSANDGAAISAAGEDCVETAELASYDLSMPAVLFRELGGFDEDFPAGTLEDHDLSLRARAAGCSFVRNDAISVLHNDPTTTLEAACRREGRRAAAAIVLAKKHPERAPLLAIVNENTRVRRTDGWRLALKKSTKATLSAGPVLRALHRAALLAERLRVPERGLFRVYHLLIALHIHRGVRDAIDAPR
jgi:GT2 family glycosyltransferase